MAQQQTSTQEAPAQPDAEPASPGASASPEADAEPPSPGGVLPAPTRQGARRC